MSVVRSDPAADPTPGALPLPPPVVPPRPDFELERRQLEAATHALQRAAAEFQARREQLANELRRDAIELALIIAERFLHEKLAQGTFPFERLITQALERIDSNQPATISLHPADLELIQARLSPDASWPTSKLEWYADAKLTRGMCRVTAQDRSVRFDMTERLQALRQQLLAQTVF